MKEIWKDIEGYEKQYQISNFGRVKSLYRELSLDVHPRHGGPWVKPIKEKIIKQDFNMGYLRSALSKNGFTKLYSTHRLVAQAFIKNPDNKPEVNHKNTIKNDNRLENLEWCTGLENMAHAKANGLVAIGESQWISKLNVEQVRLIKHIQNCRPKMLQREVAKIFDVHKNTIGLIWANRIWKHVVI